MVIALDTKSNRVSPREFEPSSQQICLNVIFYELLRNLPLQLLLEKTFKSTTAVMAEWLRRWIRWIQVQRLDHSAITAVLPLNVFFNNSCKGKFLNN